MNMKNENNTKETISALSSLEAIQFKLERLEGLTNVCACAFNNELSLSSVNEKDIESTFILLHDHVEGLLNDTNTLIRAVINKKASLDD